MATTQDQERASPTKDPTSLLPLSPVQTQILVALRDRVLHGYAIMKRIHRDSKGVIKLGSGTLYRTIKNLQVDGVVEEFVRIRNDPEFLEDERRIYYRLTEFGQQVLDAEVKRMDDVRHTVETRRLISETIG